MDPTKRQIRSKQVGPYMSAAKDPSGWVLNARQHRRADDVFAQKGMAKPGEQRGATNNPAIADSHGDMAWPIARVNPYGDGRQLDTNGLELYSERPATPPAAGLGVYTQQPWQVNEQLQAADGLRNLAALQNRTPPSPISGPPPALAMQMPPQKPGMTGPEGMPLPAGQIDQQALQELPLAAPYGQLPMEPNLDLAIAPYSTTLGTPAEASLPKASRQFTGSRGRPATMPT